MPLIYHSDIPDVAIPEQSIFTAVFNKSFDLRLPAYVDAPTGYTLSRADVRNHSLQLAWGMRNILGQKRGSTIVIFSPNSIIWPALLLGAIAAGLRITTINSAYTPSELSYQLEVIPLYSLYGVFSDARYHSGQWSILYICTSESIGKPERSTQTDEYQ